MNRPESLIITPADFPSAVGEALPPPIPSRPLSGLSEGLFASSLPTVSRRFWHELPPNAKRSAVIGWSRMDGMLSGDELIRGIR